jgi:3-oxoacyl-[acyl-carrier protein] reductase
MRVNARAPFFLCKTAIPYLEKSKAATIINISSVVGHKGYVHQAAYAASKHALTGFTKVLAREVQDKGIRVYLLSPGGVHTEMVQKMRPDLDTSGLIKTEDMADIVRFLVTHRGNAMVDELRIRRAGGMPWA